MAADISLGLGEYITVYVLGAVIGLGLLGWIFGVALGGAVLFIILAIIAVLISYAILSRGYRFLLHGSISAGSGGDGRD